MIVYLWSTVITADSVEYKAGKDNVEPFFKVVMDFTPYIVNTLVDKKVNFHLESKKLSKESGVEDGEEKEAIKVIADIPLSANISCYHK